MRDQRTDETERCARVAIRRRARRARKARRARSRGVALDEKGVDQDGIFANLFANHFDEENDNALHR